MNIVEINTCNYGSTGNIMLQIAQTAESRGHNVWVAYHNHPQNRKKDVKNSILIGNKLAYYIHTKLSLYTGLNGCGSVFSTLKFLNEVKKLKPDLIQLHNLHNCYINLPMLFRFIKKRKIPVVWTLHDCWAFTGQCAHFDMIKCDKWKNGCHNCKQIHLYPSSYVDQTKLMWKLKRKWFSGAENITLVTPSRWMAEQIEQSFLGSYPIQVINNGIDLTVFEKKESDFRKEHGIPSDKKILLGVSFGWGEKKGLDVFNTLAQKLDSEKYQIVLVGTNPETDKNLHQNILSVHKTNNQAELAEIYSAADIFINPTREEALGLVNIEANACGIPVVTFRSGGSPECICNESGSVVERDDIDAMEKEIIRICDKKPFNKNNCRKQAKNFDMNLKFKEYIDLYEEIIAKNQKKR